MFHEVYYKLLEFAKCKKQDSVLYKHHIDYIINNKKYYSLEENYLNQESNQIVVDYIAIMKVVTKYCFLVIFKIQVAKILLFLDQRGRTN